MIRRANGGDGVLVALGVQTECRAEKVETVEVIL